MGFVEGFDTIFDPELKDFNGNETWVKQFSEREQYLLSLATEEEKKDIEELKKFLEEARSICEGDDFCGDDIMRTIYNENKAELDAIFLEIEKRSKKNCLCQR